MTEGKVKFFNELKNFGFVSGDDGKDYFVHGSALEAGVKLKEGDSVTFEGVKGDRGLKAEHVRKSDGSSPKSHAKKAPQEEEEVPQESEDSDSEEQSEDDE
jgi:CspA family cold shock protein